MDGNANDLINDDVTRVFLVCGRLQRQMYHANDLCNGESLTSQRTRFYCFDIAVCQFSLLLFVSFAINVC